MSEERVVLDPWDQVSKRRRVHCGSVGVDSGSIVLGDGVDKAQREILTWTGDGCYPVFAQIVDGHRCLVIDLQATNYGIEIFNDTPGRCECGGLADLDVDEATTEKVVCGACGRKYRIDRTQRLDYTECKKTLGGH